MDFNGYSLNSKVLIVLIETEFCQKKLNIINKSDYPKFLIEILKESDRNIIKESACRMIIKLFGKSKSGDAQGDNDENDIGKIEFINLVEPLVSIISRAKENGTKLTALSVMAIVNMCNYSDDIKDIFLQKNGFYIVCELLNSKDEEILLNDLRLIMTLIASKVGEQNLIGRRLAEENDNQITKRLIKLIKEGPSINFCKFDKQVYFMAISLLRAFLQHSSDTKSLIMSDVKTEDRRYPRTVIQVMMDYLQPKNLDDINSDIESAILSLLTQVVRDEMEYKKRVGA